MKLFQKNTAILEEQYGNAALPGEKGTRLLTVSRSYDRSQFPGCFDLFERPFIRLRGNWLRDAGFDSGMKVRVEVAEGKITITPADGYDGQNTELAEWARKVDAALKGGAK